MSLGTIARRRHPHPRHLSHSLQPSPIALRGWDSIRQSDVQVRMTIVRYQIHCLVSKNDAVIIMIEDDCDATTFQCRSAQERFAFVHHVKCDLDENSSTAVCHRMSVNHFLSVVLQCHRCSLPQRRRL